MSRKRIYGGVDIGKHTSFACRIDLEKKIVQFPRSSRDNNQLVDWFQENSVSAICIDGPPRPNNGKLAERLSAKTRFNTERRVAEFALQIYGCYGTPNQQPDINANCGWMSSSMDLYRLLEDRFGWNVDLGDGNGELLETHPTYAFKSMLGRVEGPTEGDVRQIIVDRNRRMAPKRPRKAGGHGQRIQLLQQSFGQLGIEVNSVVQSQWEKSIDYVDATLCALTALWKFEELNDLIAVGDPTEGAIYIPQPTLDFDVDPVDPDSNTEASKAKPKRRTTRNQGDGDPANAIILRLGANGPGGLSQAETIALAQAALDEGENWLPLSNANSFNWSDNLNDVDHRLFLAFGNVLQLRFKTGEVRFQSGEDIEFPGTFNPWPVDRAPIWIEALSVEPVDIAEFQTRQGGEWQLGFSKRGNSSLFARVETP